jgi:GH24 family phage-related lysozyme (muramidase)
VTDEDLPAGYRAPLTEEEAADLLRSDLDRYERVVRDSVEVELSQDRFDALVSFCYNVGSGAFRGSTLLKKVNAEAHEEAAEQFLRWKYVDGEVSRGLLRRREAEAALYRGQIDEALEFEPETIDPAPIQPVPVSMDLDDPDHYPIRSVVGIGGRTAGTVRAKSSLIGSGA